MTGAGMEALADQQRCTVDFDATVARLAIEGVPVYAIARSTEKPPELIRAILAVAKQTGTIAELPRDDWPGKQPSTERTPATKSALISDNGHIMTLVKVFGITKLHARLFAVLLKRAEATKEMLHAVIEANRDSRTQKEQTDPKIVDVVICNLRKRLRTKDITIDTIWSCGYSMSAEMRAKAQALIDADLGTEAVAVQEAPGEVQGG